MGRLKKHLDPMGKNTTKRINSSAKGSRNERNLAKVLKEWTGLEFTRTPQSGGLRWKRDSQVTGDIICTSKGARVLFPFSVETKSHSDLDFGKLIGTYNSEILEFWDQAVRDATRVDKFPLLAMRKNHMGKGVYFMGLEEKAFDTLISLGLEPKLGYMRYTRGKIGIVFMDSRDLFSVDYTPFRKALKQL